MPYSPQPGDFGLSRITGWGGFVVKLGQLMIGDLSSHSHAFIVLDSNEVAEAMPGGLQINPLSKYANREVVYSYFGLTMAERDKIVETARSAEGTPYSYLGYLYLGLIYLKRCPVWIRRRVASSRQMLCSQFVDHCYSTARYELFQDGRLPQDVTPGDLCRLLMSDRTRSVLTRSTAC